MVLLYIMVPSRILPSVQKRPAALLEDKSQASQSSEQDDMVWVSFLESRKRRKRRKGRGAV